MNNEHMQAESEFPEEQKWPLATESLSAWILMAEGPKFAKELLRAHLTDDKAKVEKIVDEALKRHNVPAPRIVNIVLETESPSGVEKHPTVVGRHTSMSGVTLKRVDIEEDSSFSLVLDFNGEFHPVKILKESMLDGLKDFISAYTPDIKSAPLINRVIGGTVRLLRLVGYLDQEIRSGVEAELSVDSRFEGRIDFELQKKLIEVEVAGSIDRAVELCEKYEIKYKSSPLSYAIPPSRPVESEPVRLQVSSPSPETPATVSSPEHRLLSTHIAGLTAENTRLRETVAELTDKLKIHSETSGVLKDAIHELQAYARKKFPEKRWAQEVVRVTKSSLDHVASLSADQPDQSSGQETGFPIGNVSEEEFMLVLHRILLYFKHLPEDPTDLPSHESILARYHDHSYRPYVEVPIPGEHEEGVDKAWSFPEPGFTPWLNQGSELSKGDYVEVVFDDGKSFVTNAAYIDWQTGKEKHRRPSAQVVAFRQVAPPLQNILPNYPEQEVEEEQTIDRRNNQETGYQAPKEPPKLTFWPEMTIKIYPGLPAPRPKDDPPYKVVEHAEGLTEWRFEPGWRAWDPENFHEEGSPDSPRLCEVVTRGGNYEFARMKDFDWTELGPHRTIAAYNLLEPETP